MEPQYHDGVEDYEDFSEETAERHSDLHALSDEELEDLIDRELSRALGSYDSDEVDGNRTQALDYYFSRPRGDERTGRSAVISQDVADTVDATLADIMPVFSGTYNIVSFPPEGPDDTQQAQDETDFINYLFHEENDGYLVLYEAIKEALLLRNSVLKVFKDECYTVREEIIEGLNPMQLAALEQQTQTMQGPVEVQITEYEEQTPPPGTMMLYPLAAVKLRIIERKEKVRVMTIPLEEFRVNSDHGSISLENARFLAHITPISRGELIAEGVPVSIVMDLEEIRDRDLQQEQTSDARNRDSSESEISVAQRQAELVEIHEISMLVDKDGDGILERRFIRRVKGYIIEDMIVDYNPFVSMAPFINPHRWQGISLYDKGKQTQDIKTSIWRNLLDNLYQITNQKVAAVKGQVHLDDLLTSTPGGVVRVKSKDATYPLLNNPGTLQPAFDALQYADKARTENTGSSLDARRNQPGMPRDTAHGVERIVSARESLIGMVAKTFAETGIRQMFRKMHRVAREVIQNPEMVEYRGRFISTNPSQWRQRTKVRVAPALSMGEMFRKKMALTEVLQQQKELYAAGFDGVLVNPQGTYNASIEFCRVSGLDNPEHFWVDPQSPEAQQAIKGKQQAAQAEQQMAMQQQQQMMDLQRQIEVMGNQTKIIVQQLENAMDREKLYENSANEMTKMALEYEKDLPGDKVP